MALQAGGAVVVWGSDLYDQQKIPPELDNVVAIWTGGHHNRHQPRHQGAVVARYPAFQGRCAATPLPVAPPSPWAGYQTGGDCDKSYPSVPRLFFHKSLVFRCHLQRSTIIFIVTDLQSTTLNAELYNVSIKLICADTMDSNTFLKNHTSIYFLGNTMVSGPHSSFDLFYGAFLAFWA
jgi:hypothetical protein